MPIGPDAGTAVGHLEIESKGVQRGVSQATSALAQLEPVVRDNWWGLRNLGLAFGGIGGAVAATFASAGKAAIQWEASLAQVDRTTFNAAESMEANRAALEGLSQGLQELATNTPTPAKDLAAIAAEAGALGIARGDIVEFTSVVADLANITDLTADEAAKGMARLASVMDVPAAQFSNLASAIFEAGRSTAATEPEILNMARRISGAGAAAGLSAAEVVGLSAAVVSLGPRAEAGGTAMIKTLFDMAKAMREGGVEAQIFAKVAGTSVSEFSRIFREDAAQALTLFVEGLGKARGDAQTTQGVLANLGITEARQVTALLALAGASVNTTNEQVKLRNVLGLSTKAFDDNTARTEATARIYGTTAAQIEKLRNVIDNAKRSFGALFIPIIMVAVKALSFFARGFAAIPGPVKAVIVVLSLLFAGIVAIGAVALLVVPRIVLMRGALLQLQLQALMTTKALGSTAITMGSLNAAGAAAGAGGLAKLVGRFGKLGKAGGAVGAALAIITTGFTIYSAVANKADAATGSMGRALTDAEKEMQALQDAVSEDSGLEDLAGDLGAVEDKAKAQNQALLSLGDAHMGVAESTAQLADATETYQEALANVLNPSQMIQEAELELVKARNDQEQSALDLADAEERLGKVRREEQDKLLDAEDNVVNANDKYLDSLDKIYDDEKKLKDLRDESSLKAIIEETNKLTKARLSLREANRDVRDAEWNLQKMRHEGSARDIEDAEIALDKALQNRAESTEDVADSADKLNDLRAGEGQRQIAKAERELAKDYRDSQKALRDVGQAEQEVADLRRAISEDKAYQKALRDVEDAQLGVVQSDIAATKAERDLLKVRKDKGHKEFRDAQLGLERAVYGVAKANTELIKQQALARGEMFDSQREAQTLAAQLGAMGKSIPDADIRSRIGNVAAALKSAKQESDAFNATTLTPKLDLSNLLNLKPALDGAEQQIKQAPFKWGELLKIGIKGLAPVILGALATSVATAVFGLPLAVAVAIGIAVSVIGGIIVDKIIDSGWGGKVLGGLVRSVKEAFGKAEKIASIIWRWLRQELTVENAKEFLLEIGKAIVQGLIDGIKAAPRAVLDAVLGLLPGPLKGILKQMGISSPSKVFRRIGEQLVAGLRLGITDNTNEVERAMDALFLAATGSSTKAVALTELKDSLTGLSSAFSDPMQQAITEAQRQLEELRQQFEREMAADVNLRRSVTSMMPGTPIVSATSSVGAGTITAAGTVVNNNGDTFNIEDVQKADAAEISADIFWKKMVRRRS